MTRTARSASCPALTSWARSPSPTPNGRPRKQRSINPRFGKDHAMKLVMQRERPRLRLNADTAADLMTLNPVSIHRDALLTEALALFTSRSFMVAPVIDNAGRPVGVLSASDILVHDREKVNYLA